MATLGGVHDSHASQNSAEIDSLARFAVDEHNKKHNALLEFARVVKAREQVVAGTLHHLTLEAVDAGEKKIYEAKVWVKPWMNFKELTEFKHAGETPSFTSADLGVNKDFILPEEKRPCLSDVVSPMHSVLVPIIDLKGYEESQNDDLVQRVSNACQQLGMFQVINHGVPQDVCQSVLVSLLEFFQLPHEERAIFFTKDHSEKVKIFNYYLKGGDDQKKVAMWSETFSHPWHPTEDFTHYLPTNPPQYRDVFAAYAREIGTLMNRLLSLMSKGLGLEEGSLVRRLGDGPNFYTQANYYPPCPEPELTIGLSEHNDITALTVLLQLDGVTGLQVKCDGKWVAVDPVPDALVIILADQMQVLSNGRYRSPVHRAVTNRVLPRLSLAMFYAPNDETMIGPMKELMDEENPPIYRNYRYKEFMEEFYRQEGKRRMVKEAFELNTN